MVNGFPTAVWKRLEALERAVRFRGPRMVVLTVPTGDDGVRTPETETALIEIKRQHGVNADDLVVEIANYSDSDDPEALPQLVSITST
jgi:hypothetical protein